MKLTFSLTADPQAVFRYLSQPELFVKVHPVVYKMEPLGDQRYKVFEKMKFSLFQFSFTYEAVVKSDSIQRNVDIAAVVRKHTKIEMLYVVKPGNHGTIVEEEVNIKSPLPIRRFMEKFIRRQHNIMFENIDALGRKA
jgi:carbon monoxide dehydrogenase subunit G